MIFDDIDLTSPAKTRLEYTVVYDNTSQTALNAALLDGGIVLKTAIMSLINTAFARQISGMNNVSITAFTHRMEDDILLKIDISAAFGSLIFPLILVFPLPLLMYTTVMEKQTRIREMMKLVRFPPLLHFSSR